jgi:biopolymer transport protein ExbD
MLLRSRNETINCNAGSKLIRVSPKRVTAKLISTADLNAFSLAMVVVAFVVLAICMTSPSYHHFEFSSELPMVSHPITVGGLTWGANRHDAMMVEVARSGDIFIDNDLLPDDALVTKIRQSLNNGSEPRVYIRAHRDPPYRRVKTVLDAAQRAGVKDVSFLVYQRRLPQ